MSTPHKLGACNPSSQASATTVRAADAETVSAQIEGFLRAVSLHTGIPYDELTELYSVRRAGLASPRLATEARCEPTPAGAERD